MLGGNLGFPYIKTQVFNQNVPSCPLRGLGNRMNEWGKGEKLQFVQLLNLLK